MSKIMRKHPIISVIIICAVLVAVELLIICIFKFMNIDMSYITIGLITLVPPTAIAVIAYLKLTKLTKINIDEAVLQLDAQWRSEPIIRARKIVDVIFQKYYRIEKESKGKFVLSMEKVAIDILKLSQPEYEDAEELENKYDSKIVDLLCLIEFFDTLGFLYNNDREEVQEQIKNLFKDSVKFYYKAFHVYIDNASKHSKDRFSNFVELYDNLKN